MGKHNFENANRYNVLVGEEEVRNKTNTNVVKPRPSLLLDRRVEGRNPNDASDLLRPDQIPHSRGPGSSQTRQTDYGEDAP